jgi:hypothetical protein
MEAAPLRGYPGTSKNLRFPLFLAAQRVSQKLGFKATKALEFFMIYSIGYSTRTLPEFLQELERRGITCLIDVRSSPWSRNQPFNANQIELWCEKAGVMFRQSGDILGGMSDIPLDDPAYLAALDRIINAACREPVAIMCAEGDPAKCHRTWDVGASLLVRWGIVTRSILRDGREEDITATLRRVIPNRIKPEIRAALDAQSDLFWGL